jgi:RRXRR protein
VLKKVPILNIFEVPITPQGRSQLMFVFVLDSSKKRLNPTAPARARTLLLSRKAAAFKIYPFKIIWKEEVAPSSNQELRIKIDRGARTTGIAILRNETVLWAAEVTHRICQIRDDRLWRSVVSI